MAGTAAFLSFVIYAGLIPDVMDLFHLAPAVRITPALLFGPSFVLLLILAIIVNVMKLIPLATGITAPWESVTTWVVFSLIPFSVLIPVVGLAQSVVMPELGYTKCNILAGHPNMYFTDWVRDPSWCVQGKSRDWVRQQAASRERNPAQPSKGSN